MNRRQFIETAAGAARPARKVSAGCLQSGGMIEGDSSCHRRAARSGRWTGPRGDGLAVNIVQGEGREPLGEVCFVCGMPRGHAAEVDGDRHAGAWHAEGSCAFIAERFGRAGNRRLADRKRCGKSGAIGIRRRASYSARGRFPREQVAKDAQPALLQCDHRQSSVQMFFDAEA